MRIFGALLTKASGAVGKVDLRHSRACVREVAMQKHVMRFANDESGATAIEYGLIAALIAVGIIAAARGLGSQIGLTFNTVASTMQAA
jgi:pilus assembly protein Flp/PilA